MHSDKEDEVEEEVGSSPEVRFSSLFQGFRLRGPGSRLYFFFFTGEWRSRLTVLILKNAKEDAQQLQSLFPYILSEKILRRENTLLARILQQHTVLNCSEDYFFVFYLLGKWGKYTFAISKQDQKKNFLNYFSNQIK